ncbi:hypothetical protein JTB14_005485 [Gonioctena quinquepunctata]|nr:hypothetical protein JTB14_005485 [Gonioctena quinquepunctata]
MGKKRKKGPPLDELKLANQFEALSSQDTPEEEDTEETEDTGKAKPGRPEKNTTKQTQMKTNKPMPVIIVDKIIPFDKQIMDEWIRTEGLEHHPNFRYTNNQTYVYTYSENDHGKMRKKLVDVKIPHHTFTTSKSKTHAFILSGLDAGPQIDEKKLDLENQKVKVVKIYELNRTIRHKYMVVTDNRITVNFLRNRVRAILDTFVTWDVKRNDRVVTQCHQCQLWGHATSNCARQERCLKCAQNHLTATCTKSRETDPKCCNCGGKHISSSVECPQYIRIVKQYEARTAKSRKPNVQPDVQPRFIDTPQPEQNAWKSGQSGSRVVSRTPQGEQGGPREVSRRPPEQERSHVIQATEGSPNLSFTEPITSSYRPHMPGNENNKNTDFNTLINLGNKLNKLINIAEVIKMLKNLIQILENTPHGERNIATFEFILNAKANAEFLHNKGLHA